MTHRGLLLVLEGPLQSWGTQSRFSHRETDFEPSKSGVLGLVGAALGMPRDDEAMLRRLADLSMAVRVDREGRILIDYHTVGGGTFRGRPHGVYGTKDTVPTRRFYLMDACFVVGLSGEDHSLIDGIVEAFGCPRWPLYLGRRSCSPSRRILLGGPYDDHANDLIRSAPLQVKAPDPNHKIRCVLETPRHGADEFARPRADVPRSFRLYARKFENRFIYEEWLRVADLPGGNDVPVSPATEQPIS